MVGFLYECVNFGIEVMVWMIIIRVFLSYIPHDPSKGLWSFIYSLTNPLFNIAGKVLPMSLRVPLDWSPMVALLVLQFLIRPILLKLVLLLA